jgi:hypothetical protein
LITPEEVGAGSFVFAQDQQYQAEQDANQNPATQQHKAAEGAQRFHNHSSVPQPVTSQVSEPYVDADRAADFLQITRRQLLEMSRKRIIPGHRLGTGRHRTMWRYKISEVDFAVARGARKPSSSKMRDDLADAGNQGTIPVGGPRSQKARS